MVGVGLWFAKKHTDFDDFFLAGRSLTTPLLITTLISTYYGVDVLFGDSQLGFTDGVVAWFGYARPTYAFFLIAAFLLAQRLREEEFKSLPDILDKYYGKNTKNLVPGPEKHEIIFDIFIGHLFPYTALTYLELESCYQERLDGVGARFLRRSGLHRLLSAIPAVPPNPLPAEL